MPGCVTCAAACGRAPIAWVTSSFSSIWCSLNEPVAGLAIEANSWRHHAGKAEHDDDCRRYNALVLGGWIVLRFTWDDLTQRPDWVIAQIQFALTVRRSA